MNEAGGPRRDTASEADAFLDLLFGAAALEDLARYRPDSLRALAREALGHMKAPRRPGRADVRLLDPEGDDPALAGVTAIEIVNDDMPFLVDSTLAEIHARGLELKLVAHPVLAVERDGEGRLLHVAAPAYADGERRESLIHLHVARIVDPERRAALVEGLGKVYADVRVSVGDWAEMRARVAAAADAYKADPPPLPVDEIAEAIHFLEWLAADNFTFLGLREYRFIEAGPDAGVPGARATFDLIGGPGLGILRDPALKVLRRGRELVTVTPEVLEFLREPQALIISKANVRSRVHRRVHMDYIGCKLFSKTGALQGELRAVGLFTATAYHRSTQSIPYIRHKVARVREAADLDPHSHSGKVLAAVLESYPRDDLFQIDADTLFEFSRQIALLNERPRVRVLARPDKFDRFVSVICFMPRDHYDTRARGRVADYFATVFKGRIAAAYPYFPEGPLVRLHVIVGRDEGETPTVAQAELERAVTEILASWSDTFGERLVEKRGDQGRALLQRYGAAFSSAYRDTYSTDEALADVDLIASLTEAAPRAGVLYRNGNDAPDQLRMKVYSRGRPMPLSERVPALEAMGFRVISEDTFEIAPETGVETSMHDMLLARARPGPLDMTTLKPQIEARLAAGFRGEVESDGYDALTLEAGLGWRDVAMIRALSRYLRQARIGFSQDYLWTTLVAYPQIARKLVDLFYVRFDPRMFDDAETRAATEVAVVAEIESLLADVASLDQDRILRRFLNLVQAAERTNYFQTDDKGAHAPVISFKFESRRIANLPLPRPLYEIFLYSPRVEGVHLRFGKVARGGIRWSDRPQDFRTEILGLVKAQQVKNAVIVPVGAKGGFVPKLAPPPSQRDAWMAEGVAAYKIFIDALLDITDDLDGDAIAPPDRVVRHDPDDPYLVVAADKGTATFSDTANAISQEHGFWLDDAFASGGSAGYDHKKMGITARGAWEAVKRRFREMDRDIQTSAFTCVGVGDMSGDVFGNGMLLSPQTRLVAAFDHRDVFIDPDPDPALSHEERARLFALPRSSWQDYDKSKISAGGGVFSRQTKSIALSPQAQAALGLDRDQLTPPELITAILKAPVDLLWFGGIGAYVRGSAESDDQVGDRANDAIRIVGKDVRAKVIGEGANLGVTQQGRIEAARAGVRLDTDAIDNSAGVNTSDMEVNIKIALAPPMREGALDRPARDALLVAMTDDVAKAVLRNNYMQTLALSLAARRGVESIDGARALMRGLEREGRLDRAVENLPDDAELAERAADGDGLTHPELAVLLAYAKISLYDHLLASDVPDDRYFSRELTRYFPPALIERFPNAVEEHRLRREIVATQLANAIVNRGGPEVVARMADETGADAAKIAKAFAAVRDIFALTALNAEIDALDNRVGGELQLQLYEKARALLLSRMIWVLRHADLSQGVEATAGRFRAAVVEIAGGLESLLQQADVATLARESEKLQAQGVPASLARRLAALDWIALAPDVALVAERSGASVATAARAFFEADAAFGVSRLAAQSTGLALADRFDRLALERALDRLAAARRAIAAQAMATPAGDGGHLAAWRAARGPDLVRIQTQIADVTASGLTLSKLSVAAGLLGDLAAS